MSSTLSFERATPAIRLLAFIEAATVTGPAKNLLDFCRTAASGTPPVKVHIATFSRTGNANGFTQAVRGAGVDLTVIPERRSLDFNVAKGIRDVIDKLRPDIVQTHAVKSHFLMALSNIKGPSRWVAFHHGYTTTDLKMRLYNQLDRWSLRRPARIVTVSRAFAQQLTSRGIDPARISVLQNAVAPDWADRVLHADRPALRRQLQLGDNEKVILAVGRMSVEKAHNDLIRAFHLLRRDRKDVRLLLVGEGPERQVLEAMAGEGVIFPGQTGDIAPYYAVADVMALPSLTEGSPNVLLEAMACGLPCAATTVGGIPEIVRDGESALLVPPRDPAKMAAAIQRLLSDPGLTRSLTDCALALIQSKHSVEARAQSLFEIYSALCKAPA